MAARRSSEVLPLPVEAEPGDPPGDLPLSGVALPDVPEDWVPAEGSEGSEPLEGDGIEGIDEPPLGIEGMPPLGEDVGEGMPALPPPLGELEPLGVPPGLPLLGGPPPPVVWQPTSINEEPSSDARIAAGMSGACARVEAAFICLRPW
jgi:hypothetical protein